MSKFSNPNKPTRKEFEELMARCHQITLEMKRDQIEAQKILNRWMDRDYVRLGKGLKWELNE